MIIQFPPSDTLAIRLVILYLGGVEVRQSCGKETDSIVQQGSVSPHGDRIGEIILWTREIVIRSVIIFRILLRDRQKDNSC